MNLWNRLFKPVKQNQDWFYSAEVFWSFPSLKKSKAHSIQ
jgi:hypothetical protein